MNIQTEIDKLISERDKFKKENEDLKNKIKDKDKEMESIKKELKEFKSKDDSDVLIIKKNHYVVYTVGLLLICILIIIDLFKKL